MRYLFGILIFLFITPEAFAQNSLPVIHATTKNLVIKDGAHLIEGVIVPEAKPDIYWAEMPYKPQRISIHTDRDSIVFETQVGKNYDFIILLNGRDSCYLRVSTQPRLVKTIKNCSPTGSDTLPFTLRNNRIFLKGSINGIPDLMIQLDLGAGCSAINHRSVKKIPMHFDTETYLVNSDGGNKVPASTKNTLKIGNLIWESEFFVETRNMERWEDAIVGNSLFLDKYLEIDYDHHRLIVHKEMPNMESSYFKNEMFLDGGIRPCIPFSIEVGKKKYTHWYVFDTGLTGNGRLGRSVSSIPDIYGGITKLIGFGTHKVGILPKLFVGTHEFEKLIFSIEKPQSTVPVGNLGVIGNAVLNRFNAVIDNKQGYIYLKSNGLADTPLETSQSVVRKVLIGVGVLGVVAFSIFGLVAVKSK